MSKYSGRGRVLAAVLAGLMLVATSGAALHAQAGYPERPVRIVLPYGPGGVADVTMRLIAQQLSERMGKNFYIENRPGAGGIIAGRAVLSSPADGYTFFLTGNGNAISESLFKSLPYSMDKDFTSVATLAQFEILLATNANSNLKSIADVIAAAKAHPGKINFGTIATGSTQNLSAELFRMTTGVKVTMVPYHTTPELMNAITRGDVDVGFDYYAAMRPMIDAKKIRVIATTGDAQDPLLPGVPTVKASGYPDYVVTSWNAVSARMGTPKEIINKVNDEINAILKTDLIKSRMAQLGMQPYISTPAQMDARMRDDTAKWRAVIDKVGIPKM